MGVEYNEKGDSKMKKGRVFGALMLPVFGSIAGFIGLEAYGYPGQLILIFWFIATSLILWDIHRINRKNKALGLKSV